MDCTVTLLYDGKSVVHPLQKAWGKKYACTFKHDLGSGPKRIRVVVEIDGREVSGFIRIGSEEVSLPQQRLKKTAAGFGTYWPPSWGITVGINTTGDLPETQAVKTKLRRRV